MNQPCSQGLPSFTPVDRKMRNPGSKVEYKSKLQPSPLGNNFPSHFKEKPHTQGTRSDAPQIITLWDKNVLCLMFCVSVKRHACLINLFT